MSDYEILSIVLKMITLVATLLIAYIDNTKKVTARSKLKVTSL